MINIEDLLTQWVSDWFNLDRPLPQETSHNHKYESDLNTHLECLHHNAPGMNGLWRKKTQKAGKEITERSEQYAAECLGVGAV